MSGRALPVWPLVLYMVYSAVVTTLVILFVPNYQNLTELKALQFPIQTLGNPPALFFVTGVSVQLDWLVNVRHHYATV